MIPYFDFRIDSQRKNTNYPFDYKVFPSTELPVQLADVEKTYFYEKDINLYFLFTLLGNTFYLGLNIQERFFRFELISKNKCFDNYEKKKWYGLYLNKAIGNDFQYFETSTEVFMLDSTMVVFPNYFWTEFEYTIAKMSNIEGVVLNPVVARKKGVLFSKEILCQFLL